MPQRTTPPPKDTEEPVAQSTNVFRKFCRFRNSEPPHDSQFSIHRSLGLAPTPCNRLDFKHHVNNDKGSYLLMFGRPASSTKKSDSKQFNASNEPVAGNTFAECLPGTVRPINAIA
jgi:hypothetical protein